MRLRLILKTSLSVSIALRLRSCLRLGCNWIRDYVQEWDSVLYWAKVRFNLRLQLILIQVKIETETENEIEPEIQTQNEIKTWYQIDIQMGNETEIWNSDFNWDSFLVTDWKWGSLILRFEL